MKEHRLTGWPELAPAFHRTAYRRLLSDMSHRFVSELQLAQGSGLKRREVRAFVAMLDERGLLAHREAAGGELPQRSSLGGWLRRALSFAPDR